MSDSFSGSSNSTPATPNNSPTSTESGQGSSRGGSPTTSGGDGQVSEMLKNMQAEMGNLRQTAQRAQGESAQSRKVLEKIQNVFTGDEGEGDKEPPWFDNMLGEILEAKQKGIDLPMTSRLAVELHKSQQETAELKELVKKLAGQTDHMADPETQVNNRAYDQMDQFVGQSLENVFGGEYPPGMGSAVTKSVVGFLKELRQESPEKWIEIRRNANMQKKIVQHYVNQHIPSHLRELQKNVTESQQPFTKADAIEAYQEAMTLKPEQRAKVMPLVRQKLLETMWSEKNPRHRG